ncbi:Telomere-binding protein like [Actinidia chinensis var. chinensis]|uniref:Telomere-binding protein like n=1 Tax=Actinidia chinensis var. chinensis TaxID=1590841 RepID=A0A2R6RBK3_ACTCC|nr:Telomere-binding protein like [Actinidia chinensis var. chinensis]
MAHPSEHRLCSAGVLRGVLVWVSLFVVAYIVGRPIFWHSRDNSYAQSSCPPCDCDCDADNIFSIPIGFLNSSYSDCGKNDPDINEEMEKDRISLLSEELRLQKNVTDDSLKRTNALIMDAKKTSSHYQREAEKCNAGMETCEEARERSVAALTEERKLSALWESRALEHGWKDESRIYS